MPRSALRLSSFCLLFGLLFYCSSKSISADTTIYRSAATVTTDNISGNTSNKYTDLSNCSATDGLTCNRALGLGAANLYFRDFGDFGIPSNSVITGVRIRVTGKSDISTYAGVSVLGSNPGIPFPANCQDPSDKWTMTSLVSQNIQTYNVTSINGVDFINCLNAANIRSNNFIFRINRAGPVAWSANIDNLEIAFDYQIAPSPTPSPSPSPSPTPTPPTPFLDLPWDYKGKGLSFNDAALSINSFFDHEYPLLSTNLTEPIAAQNSIIFFKGGERNFDEDYSSHDGYDYGTPAKVEYGDEVLAAYSGTAKLINTCGPCGNAIYIDHGNGYQTRYYHLESDGLITNAPGQEIQVDSGDVIGKVGATGNVRPKGEDGAHIHFMVVQDKNNDGDFEDNIPDGVTDPFGWQSKNPDPWENYLFFYNGSNRTGNKSYYLWKEKIDELDTTLDSNGGFFVSGRNSINFPEGATNRNLILEIISAPIQRISDLLRSIGPTIEVTAEDLSGNEVTNFNKPFSLTIDFSDLDLSRITLETLSIYSTSDGIDWVKEDTEVDLENKKASAEINHLTRFALVAERKDIIPANTSAILNGEKGTGKWYRSDVLVDLSAIDNENGLGVDYIFYKKANGDWKKYENPISFTSEGEHTLEFYSVDNDENIENLKSVVFNIDKTPPEAEIYYSTALKRIEVKGLDNSGIINISTLNSSGNRVSTITDAAGNKLILTYKVSVGSILSTLNVISGQQNNKPKVTFPKNSTLISLFYNLKTKNLETVAEVFSMKDKNLLGLIYNISQNKTKIYTYDAKNRQVFKEEKTGENLLKLYTESSTLKYRY